jgi:prepilin-type N-terminal cleavage/methylation domain-containing protein
MPHCAHKQGFTLIELSMVLVIIGLIVGGVLTGRELIHAAELRRVMRQVEEYNTAFMAFRLKYNCLPGDCLDAVDFGLGVDGGVGDNGDGDERILPTEQTDTWYHLMQANMITANLATVPGSGGHTMPTLHGLKTTNRAGVSPVMAVWYNTVTTTPLAISGHAFWITSRYNDAFNNAGIASLSPADAYILDFKTDDGLPLTGKVLATRDTGTFIGQPRAPVPASGTDRCVNSDVTPNPYGSVRNTAIADSLCGIVFKTVF